MVTGDAPYCESGVTLLNVISGNDLGQTAVEHLFSWRLLCACKVQFSGCVYLNPGLLSAGAWATGSAESAGISSASSATSGAASGSSACASAAGSSCTSRNFLSIARLRVPTVESLLEAS